MKKYIHLLLVTLLVVVTLIGCSNKVEPEDKVVKQNKEITLYFSDPDAIGVMAEKRTISIQKNLEEAELLKLAVEELIKGPTTKELHRTIPKEVKVLSVKIDKNIAYVDFSQEMHTKHWGGSTGESMTIESIVNTLTEFSGINKVMMTVEGNPLAIEHMIVEEPIERHENTITKTK